jgi:hypothetical protein
VRQVLVAGLGFLWGLFLTWLTLYVVSHVHWLPTHAPSSGCSDLEHCGSRPWYLFALFGTLLWPAFGFSFLNAIAYKRWPVRRWGLSFAIGTALTVAFYVVGQIV